MTNLLKMVIQPYFSTSIREKNRLMAHFKKSFLNNMKKLNLKMMLTLAGKSLNLLSIVKIIKKNIVLK